MTSCRQVIEGTVMLDFGIVHRDTPEAFQEQAIRFFHDVRFMHGCDFLSFKLSRVLESEQRNSRARLLRYNLQRFDNPRHNFVLQPRVQALGIFTDDDQIHFSKSRWHAGQMAHRPQVRIQVEYFPQADVDALKPAPNRRCNGPFQRDAISANGFDDLLR